MRRTALAVAAAAGLACGRTPHVPTGPNPLGDPSVPLWPFPSSYFLVEDRTSTTGVRVSLLKSVLPKSDPGVPLDPTPYNRFDGFSPATSIFLYFRSGVDLTGVANVRDFGPSLLAESPIQILNYGTGERVMFFAEMDANAGPGDPQALILRPQQHLAPASRYVVALRNMLVDPAGRPLESPAAFAQVRDGKATGESPLANLRDRYEDVFRFLGRSGIARSELVLAFDFITASDAPTTGRLVAMRDRAFEAAPGTFRVTSSVDSPGDPNLLRKIKGTFDAPSFLDRDDVKGVLRLDARGDPVLGGNAAFPFVAHIPQCAATSPRPLPVMLYGHGLFGSADGEMSSSYHLSIIQRFCVVEIGTNWIGLSEDDRITNVVQEVLVDFNRFNLVTDRLQQAQVNWNVLQRLIRTRLKDAPEMALNGKPVIDGSEMYYFGISNGAIQGSAFMALNPDIERGVLNVGGSTWSLMVHRSSNFAPISIVFDIYYPRKIDQQLLIGLSQAQWDYVDPATYGPHLLGDPLPGVAKKRILYQEAIGDAQVPNLATRIMVRAMGIPGLAPGVHAVPGVEEKTGPLDSGYVQYDVHPSPQPPENNVPPPTDNPAHGAVRKLEACLRQIEAFLKPDGRVIQTCSGPCDPE